MKLIISKKEIERRIEELTRIMSSKGVNALYLVTPANITYTTNFYFIPTERPIAALIKDDGEKVLFVPRLEHDHAEKYSYADKVLSYPEYPDEKHPMLWIADYVRELGLSGKTIGFDVDGYGHVHGYRGPRLSEVLKDTKFVYARDIVEELRMIKSLEEILLMKESAKWTIYVHRLLQEYVKPGLYEDEIAFKASMEATLTMAKTLKGIYRPVGWVIGAHAGFRGQVGPHSYYPHSLTQHAIIRRGDVLVSGATACISGYGVELERTMIVGEPSDIQAKYFKLMLKAQEVAFNMIRPGVKCSDVDRAVRKFFKEHDLMKYWRHHTGHGLGLEFHEAPFLDIGYNVELKPGMIVSVEPGIYVPEVGGFRHSDTVLVTEDGYEVLTEYPRELEELIIYD